MDNNDAVIGIAFLVFCGSGIILCLLLLSASINGTTRSAARVWYEEQQRLSRKSRKTEQEH